MLTKRVILFQGFFDRFLYMAPSDVPSLMLNEQISPIPQDKSIDLEKYLKTVIKTNKTDPAYSISGTGASGTSFKELCKSP